MKKLNHVRNDGHTFFFIRKCFSAKIIKIIKTITNKQIKRKGLISKLNSNEIFKSYIQIVFSFTKSEKFFKNLKHNSLGN